MKIIIEINTDNAAFGEDYHSRGLELGRIFTKLADRAFNEGISYSDSHSIRDLNGNVVGMFKVIED